MTNFQKGIMKSANMQNSSFLSRFWQYFLALMLIAFLTAIFFVLRDILDTTLIALLYLIPLGVITALWGLGSGILGVCKGIIEAHGGRIWAENLPNGLAFNFTLPLTWEGTKPPQLPIESEAK